MIVAQLTDPADQHPMNDLQIIAYTMMGFCREQVFLLDQLVLFMDELIAFPD